MYFNIFHIKNPIKKSIGFGMDQGSASGGTELLLKVTDTYLHCIIGPKSAATDFSPVL